MYDSISLNSSQRHIWVVEVHRFIDFGDFQLYIFFGLKSKKGYTRILTTEICLLMLLLKLHQP